MRNNIILAFGSVPKDGGTFTFYRNIRPALFEYGIDIRCVAIGKLQADLWEDNYADEGCVLLAAKSWNIKRQAKVFVEWCEKEKVDVVMGINSEAILSSIPHLPQRVKVLSRCANGFDHGYRITLSGDERLSKIIALTPKLKNDLVHEYGVDPARIDLIPNGIDPNKFEHAAKTKRGKHEKLSLAFLGRLEHNQKGVLHIPKIVKELNRQHVNFELKIAGKGVHKGKLEDELKSEIKNNQVKLIGVLSPNEIPNFLAKTDVFLFTSHFEGCPNALLEAIMAGCVPVSWLIEGITDFIIEDGRTGFLCCTSDYTTFAKRVKSLDMNREMLQQMSVNIAQLAREVFANSKTAGKYATLIKYVIKDEPIEGFPKSWSEFRPDPNFRHSLTEYLPVWLVAILKRLFSR